MYAAATVLIANLAASPAGQGRSAT